MRIGQKSGRKLLFIVVWFAVLITPGLNASRSFAQEAQEPLPEVTNAVVPFYPPIALAARISGVVRLHLSTDGKHVSAVTAQGGPAMLIPAAEENVRTWTFADHVPTTFDVSFRYVILTGSGCDTGNKPVILHLPTEVEIDAMPQTCDTVRFFRNQKIRTEQHAYAVELHVTYNGLAVENPSEVEIRSSVQSVTLPVRSGLFLVPEAMAAGSDLTFKATIGQDQIEIPGISPSALEESWTIMLADKSFGEDYDFAIRKGKDVRSECILSFDPLDGDGTFVVVSACRKPMGK